MLSSKMLSSNHHAEDHKDKQYKDLFHHIVLTEGVLENIQVVCSVDNTHSEAGLQPSQIVEVIKDHLTSLPFYI
jgi:hypothetical protein